MLEYCVKCFIECVDEFVKVFCIEVGKFIKDVKGEVICFIDIFKIVVEELVCINGEMVNLEIFVCVKGY